MASSEDRAQTAIRGKHLYLDCFAGIAGDMFLGAMLDLGVPEQHIRAGLAQVPLSGYRLQIARERRRGIEGCDVKVIIEEGGEEGGHPHGHRSWREIRELLERSDLEASVKRRALDIFTRIARAEGRIHGMPVEEVSFHEVGAIDSIVDIVGAALALDYLAPALITSRPVPLGHGTVKCAHGVFPVPAPAALEILAGAQVTDGGLDVELCTPTGAAIVASCVESFGELPAGVLIGVGYGAGDSDLEQRPNHLRAILLEPRTSGSAEAMGVIEANIDDMPPEWCGHLTELMFEAGARDVWYTPIVMKKGRPAITLSALCTSSRREQISTVLLEQSTSIGLRFYQVERQTLARRIVEVETPYGRLQIKVALDGQRVINASPEFEICRAAAKRLGVPLKEVYAAAITAFRNLPKGATLEGSAPPASGV